MENTSPERGFIALMSAIIVSAILLVVVIGGNLTGLFTRFNILDSELKERSSALADACIDTILSKLAGDSSYTATNSDITVSSGDTCTIVSTSVSGSSSTFKVKAHYKNAYTEAMVTIDTNALSITSWQEVGNLQ